MNIKILHCEKMYAESAYYEAGACFYIVECVGKDYDKQSTLFLLTTKLDRQHVIEWVNLVCNKPGIPQGWEYFYTEEKIGLHANNKADPRYKSERSNYGKILVRYHMKINHFVMREEEQNARLKHQLEQELDIDKRSNSKQRRM